MTDTQHLIIRPTHDDEIGEIVISPDVMEVIIGIAASKVEGVHAMQGTLATNVNALFGRASHGKGVSLNVLDNGDLEVDLDCYVDFGVSVPKVATDMQEKVRQQVLNMTDLNLSTVNVHVVGMAVEEHDNDTSAESLFESEDEKDD